MFNTSLLLILICTIYIDKWVLQYPVLGGKPENEAQSSVEITSKEIIIKFKVKSKTVTFLTINRDLKEWGEEEFSILLSFKKERKEGYYFAINALNKQIDAKISRYNEMDINWDARWFSKAEYTDTLWEGEIRLPLDIFDFDPDRDTIWYFNLEWVAHTEEGMEIATYIPIKEGVKRYDLRCTKEIDVEIFYKRGLNLSLYPYTAFFREENNSLRAGSDILLSLDYWTVYFTFNPEYASIEADIEQFNLEKRNIIYLMEKRPFFIEGFELWKMPFEVLYTRSFTDIDFGGKINFEKDNLEVNAFLILERDTLLNRFSFNRKRSAGGTRIVYDFENISTGIFYIGRGEKERGYGGDLILFLPRGFNLQAQFTHAHGKDIYLYLERRGSEMGLWINSGFEYLDSTFSLSTSYIAYEKNTYSYWTYAGYNWVFDRKILPSYSISVGGTDAYFLRGKLFERTGSLCIGIYPVSSIEFYYSFDPKRRFYRGTYYNNYLHWISVGLGINYPHTLRFLICRGSYFGNFLRLHDISYRFSLWGKIIGSVTYSIETLNEHHRERLTFKFTFCPFKRIYFRAFFQESGISKRSDLNFLFQYEFFAGSNLYLVYNYSKTSNLKNRMWMGKIAYEFRL